MIETLGKIGLVFLVVVLTFALLHYGTKLKMVNE